MNAVSFSVHVEQLLIPVGTRWYGLNVRTFEPAEPIGTVVYFHAFDGNGRDFQVQSAFLAGIGYRVICPDMLGRGDSAFLVHPHIYTLKIVTESAAAVLHNYVKHHPCAIVAEGWGAVIALLAARLASVEVTHWVCSNVNLDYRVEADPDIAAALRSGGGQPHRAVQDINALPTGILAETEQPTHLQHRLRIEEGTTRLHFDHAIVDHVSAFANRTTDLRPLLGELSGKLLLAFSSANDAAKAEDFCKENPPRRSVAYLRVSGPKAVNVEAMRHLSTYFNS